MSLEEQKVVKKNLHKNYKTKNKSEFKRGKNCWLSWLENTKQWGIRKRKKNTINRKKITE